MTSDARKLCLVGEPGVGKSALLQRLAAQAPETPRGIVQAACEVGTDGEPLPVALWDIAGATALDSLNQAFLSGIDGIAAVADATRPATAATALRLVAQIRRLYPGTPAVLLLNKRDRGAPVPVPPIPAADVDVFEVSALRGENVRDAFAALARRAHRRQPARAG